MARTTAISIVFFAVYLTGITFIIPFNKNVITYVAVTLLKQTFTVALPNAITTMIVTTIR